MVESIKFRFLFRHLLVPLVLVTMPCNIWGESLSVSVDGQARAVLLHEPATLSTDTLSPLVIVLHGAMMNGDMVRSMSGIDELADIEGFLVAYPDGQGKGRLKSWNAGGVKGPMAKGGNDSEFIAALIDHLVETRGVDPQRVYATGISNGAMMCYRLACEIGDRIAAIAPVAGTQAITECDPARPVPILHFHGTEDNFVPYEGPNKTTPPFLTFQSVDETLDRWREHNGCYEEPLKEAIADRHDDSTAVERLTYTATGEGAPIILYRISGGGHTWPGRGGGSGMIGRSTKEIDANRLMWDFFQKHRLRSKAMASDNEDLKVFDFSREGASPWRSIDDSVMGGVSESDMKIVEDAARFSGSLSLKNNGGFASVRSDAQEFNLNGREGLRIHVRGDGRKYQLRLRSTTAFDGPSYTASFATEAGKWIETDLPFNSFRATYRGRDLPEYPELDPSSIRTFGILLGDKQEGDFELDISSISAYSQ